MDLLVVEDGPTIQGLVSEHLGRMGVSFKIAENGQEAIEMAQREWPRAVLLDLGLPGGMNGWDVWDRLLAMANGRPVRVIIFSAVMESPEQEKAEARGGGEVLMKPTNPDHMKMVIKRVLASGK